MKKILYIEDNQDTADAVKIILDKEGYKTEALACGKDALKRISEENFDLILLDIMLPDMSGWDIFETLKKRNVNTKFAFLSAIPISSDRMTELEKAGISDYITKPFSKIELIEKVNKILD